MVWWQVPGDAMSLLNMNLMRKGPRYWSDSHCFDLVDAALEACEAREHELMPPPKKSRTSTEAALARQVPQARRPTSGFGSLLCQDALARVVVGLVVTGPGRGLSEVLVWGCEPAALD